MSDATAASRHVPLAEVLRGSAVESLHFGSVAVVDRRGQVLRAAGDPYTLTFTRSALKPLQALPFIADGGVERFGFSQAQVALMCASHSGEPRHVDAVADMLARCGCTPATCNAARTRPAFTTRAAKCRRRRPTRRCSTTAPASTAACLPIASSTGADGDYLAFDHPLQQAIRRAVVARSPALPRTRLVAGIDGCSAPNYAVPLARARARRSRGSPRRDVDAEYGMAPRMLADAMTAHPEMVSGERRSDLALMQAGRGDWVTKIGAEGVQAIGIRSRGSASRSRSPTARSGPLPGDRRGARRNWASSTRRAAGAGALGTAARCATTAASRPGEVRPAVVARRLPPATSALSHA